MHSMEYPKLAQLMQADRLEALCRVALDNEGRTNLHKAYDLP